MKYFDTVFQLETALKNGDFTLHTPDSQIGVDGNIFDLSLSDDTLFIYSFEDFSIIINTDILSVELKTF